MLPAMLSRVEELRKALVPVPDDMLEEVTFHMGSYYIPLDAESQPCRNHSAALFDSFLAEELWAIKCKYNVSSSDRARRMGKDSLTLLPSLEKSWDEKSN